MVPRQHSDDPTTHLDTGAKEQVCGCVKHARDGGVLPTTGFPRISGMETSDKSDTVQTVHLIHHTTFVHERPSRGYTFEACVFKADRVRRGSSCSRGGSGSRGTR